MNLYFHDSILKHVILLNGNKKIRIVQFPLG